MSLQKVTYVDDDIAIYADNMNDIQDEVMNTAMDILYISDAVTKLDERVTAVEEARSKQ